MKLSRRSAKESPDLAIISTSAKAEILEVQRQQESQESAKDEFKFTEQTRVSVTHSYLSFVFRLSAAG